MAQYKRGTPEYEAWILTPIYTELCRKRSDRVKGNKNPMFGTTGRLKKGTPEYEAWVLTPEYQEHCKKISEINAGRTKPEHAGVPKKGTPRYNVWILTPEYEEYCKKISVANTGKTRSLEIRKEMSIARLGKPKLKLRGRKRPDISKRMKENNPLHHPTLGEERRRKISIKSIGKKCPEVSKRMSGENNPQWRNWISRDPYSPEFDKFFKRQIRILYGNICVFPGCCITPEENGKNLATHHYDYNKKSLYCVPLCNYHNIIVNTHRDEWEEYFTWFVRMYLEWYGRTPVLDHALQIPKL